MTNQSWWCIIEKPLREWRNRQTRTFEGRVVLPYGFDPRFPHQQKQHLCKQVLFLLVWKRFGENPSRLQIDFVPPRLRPFSLLALQSCQLLCNYATHVSSVLGTCVSKCCFLLVWKRFGENPSRLQIDFVPPRLRPFSLLALQSCQLLCNYATHVSSVFCTCVCKCPFCWFGSVSGRTYIHILYKVKN